MLKEIKNLITNSQHIYIFPDENRKESICLALALFYTLNDLKKNVNLGLNDLPEKMNFLAPSLDYLSTPKNFVISLPKEKAEASQIRYEKDEKSLKIYLTISKGNIKKNDISFCLAEPKPDLIITIGFKDINGLKKPELLKENNFFETEIINIDNQESNEKFGKINLVENNRPLGEIVFNLIKSLDESLIKEKTAEALLAAIILSSDNFQNNVVSPEILEMAAFLIKKGANRKTIIKNLFPSAEIETGFNLPKENFQKLLTE